jgi:hypothetical protein
MGHRAAPRHTRVLLVAVPVVIVVLAAAAFMALSGDDSAPAGSAAPGSSAIVLTEPTPGASESDTTPRFAGSATHDGDTGARIAVRVYDGAEVAGRPVRTSRVITDSSGGWSVENGTPLKPGTYTARAEQRGGGQPTRRSTPVTFTVSDPGVGGGDPALIAAGDIASCGSMLGDEQTAAVVSKLTGDIQTIGDNAYDHGTAAEFECFDSSWGRFKDRIHPSLGDHEFDRSETAEPYFAYFGSAAGDPLKGWYSYDLGSWHIIVTNPNCGRIEGGCEEGGEQEQWLRQDLAGNPRQCTLAVIGGPLFSSGKVHGSESSYHDFWKALYDEGADVVLSADDHLYERFAPQTPDGISDVDRGIRQFTVGTGGYFLYDFAKTLPLSEVRENGTHGVLRLTLHPASYDWKFHPVAGSTFTDTGSSECH